MIAWALQNWRLLAFAAVLGFAGIQSYRLQGAAAERDRLALEKRERATRDAVRAAANERNKERTDEEYAAARRRAAAVRVRPQPAAARADAGAAQVVARGGDSSDAGGGGGGRDDEALAEFARRLDAGIAAVEERHAERLTGVAREGEALAAAFRSCRAWALSLAGRLPWLPWLAPGPGSQAWLLGQGLGAAVAPGPGSGDARSAGAPWHASQAAFPVLWPGSGEPGLENAAWASVDEVSD